MFVVKVVKNSQNRLCAKKPIYRFLMMQNVNFSNLLTTYDWHAILRGLERTRSHSRAARQTKQVESKPERNALKTIQRRRQETSVLLNFPGFVFSLVPRSTFTTE